MRTTLSTMNSKIVNNLSRITTDVSKINDQISSGLQMSRLSDKPTNLVSALGFRTTIVEIDQYTENIEHGNNIITASESAYTQIKDMTLTAKTLTIQAINGTLGQENFNAIAEQVGNLYDQSVSLANTQNNGKYIFGGYRTTGYNDVEPEPFMTDKGDGHWINGVSFNNNQNGEQITGSVATTLPTLQDIGDGDLLVNGTSLGAIVMTPPILSNGLNMAGTDTMRTAINAQTGTTNVTASFTTLYSNIAATGDTLNGQDTILSFDLNGTIITATVPDGSNSTGTANAIITAINNETDNTGVIADIGNATSTNGGITDSIIFSNLNKGDESAITVTNFTTVQGDATAGFLNFSQSADATHNNGAISLFSSETYTLTSPNHNDDTILDVLGLGGGGIGFVDDAADGTLTSGPRLDTNDLIINGIAVPPPTNDGFSDVLIDASAAAKASAINSIEFQTGVTAKVIPVDHKSQGAVTSGTELTRLNGLVTNNAVLANTLAINGTLIPNDINGGAVVNGLSMAKAVNAKTEINALSGTTNVSASLTTLHDGTAAQTTGGGAMAVTFSLNGVSISLNTGGVSGTATAKDVVNAINTIKDQTGVEAKVGDGTNGGVVDAIIFNNVIRGNENDITLSGLDIVGAPSESVLLGLTDGTYKVNAGNTGEISLQSDSSFTITSPTVLDDSIIAELGLGDNGTGTRKYGSTPKYLDSGDLIINGIDIFATTTAIIDKDIDSALTSAINAQTAITGIQATRDVNGSMILTAQDGRNLHLQTSAQAESIINLNGGSRDKIYFGTLQLTSNRKFSMQSSQGDATNLYEPGFAAIGMSGGTSITGEPNDIAGDGKIDVFSIHEQPDYLRYTGDRENNLEIKIGKTNTMTVSENGQTGLMGSDVFTTLKNLENYLLGENFTTVTGIHKATNTSIGLNSKDTGLEPETQLPDEDLFTDGSFRVRVTDHDFYPARETFVIIGVDTTHDSLDSVTKRIDGIPHLSATWNSSGNLEIVSDEPSRYTIRLDDDSSNFLNATGTTFDSMQQQAFSQTLTDLDTVMSNLTDLISDFGARANRIDIQANVYSSMNIATKENLSEMQDTDFTQAVMDLKAKEVAYQAALSAAAKTMQVSLVDYL